MSSLTLPPPIKVSPLIRLLRWSCLLSGIYYGITHRRYITAYSAKRREKMRPIKEERELSERIEEGEALRILMADIAKETDAPLPPEYFKPCYGTPCKDTYKK